LKPDYKQYTEEACGKINPNKFIDVPVSYISLHRGIQYFSCMLKN
jgi:hypothetical protein